MFVILLVLCVFGPSNEAVASPPVATPAVVSPINDTSLWYGDFCCDVWGTRRCLLEDSAPVGARCFCYGQGYGRVCE